MDRNSQKHRHRRSGILPSGQSADRDLAKRQEAGEPLLPHERDESPAPTEAPVGERDVIEQAARDVRQGLRDTDRRGTPSDVPGPGHDPQRTPGADVPPPRPKRPS